MFIHIRSIIRLVNGLNFLQSVLLYKLTGKPSTAENVLVYKQSIEQNYIIRFEVSNKRSVYLNIIICSIDQFLSVSWFNT